VSVKVKPVLLYGNSQKTNLGHVIHTMKCFDGRNIVTVREET
jgi:hypothetical protein